MESILFTLDVFFMFLLILAVFRADRDGGPSADLGFFAFRDGNEPEPEKKPMHEGGPHA